MYDETLLSDPHEIAQEVRNALDYLIAAHEILTRYEVLSVLREQHLVEVINRVQNDIVTRNQALEEYL